MDISFEELVRIRVVTDGKKSVIVKSPSADEIVNRSQNRR